MENIRIKDTGVVVTATPVFDYYGCIRYYIDNNENKIQIYQIDYSYKDIIPNIKNMESEIKNKKSISDKLSKYGYCGKKDSFIEVTEWVNGEGYDISINDKMISLSYTELDAINYLIKKLEYEGK